jgi:hypothetical protein
MTIQRQTKRFAELTATNFEYDGQNYTVKEGNIAINDETRITQHFSNEALVIELQIIMK